MVQPVVKDDPPHRLAVFSSSGELCPGCRLPLPIRSKLSSESFAHWQCEACRTPLTGVLVNDITPKMAESIRIAQIHFDTSDVAPLPESMRELLTEFVQMRHQTQTEEERRANPRISQQLDVTVVPVGKYWMPCGKPILGAVVDLTPHGLGMVTRTLGGVGHVALQIGTSKGLVQLLGRIVWTKELGQGFEDSGVQFLLRFGRTPMIAEPKPPAVGS